MKNIHVLPTEKPSRLVLSNNNILTVIKESNYNFSHIKSVHIYITSDEELVLGGYHFNSKYGDEPQKTNQRDIGSKKYWEEEDYYITKIILTTDQELIADGVQAIDDEFLEWFGKNQSCENVHVYKEHKQINQDNIVTKGSTALVFSHYVIYIPKEELQDVFFTNKSESSKVERMYSEEEVKQIIDATLIEYSDFVLADIPHWFEQFKKK
jgi:hypothetical protein